MHAPLLREAADEIERLRKAIGTVCEGWTLPPGARKVLESAIWADVTPNVLANRPPERHRRGGNLQAQLAGGPVERRVSQHTVPIFQAVCM
jgi:hypothetical protein